MSGTRPSSTRAPIEYDAVRRSYHLARGTGAALMLAFTTYGIAAYDLSFGWVGLAAALIVLVDAVYRFGHGDSALWPLLVDITAVGSSILLSGGSAAIEATGIVYVLVASLLLLPLRTALITIAYAVGFVATAVAISVERPGGLLGATTEETAEIIDLLAALVIIGIIAVVLVEAVRALLEAQDRAARALEQERRAVEIKNEFVSMVSHELRTPLTGIAGFTDTLKEAWRSLPPDEVDEFLTIMRGETEHLANLVEDILVIPRLEAGYLRLHPEPLDVVEATVDAAELILGGRLDFEISLTGPVIVTADPIRLNQILRNLLGNALKYGGDQVLIEGRHYGANEYLVAISDNGPGVPETDQNRIFEHFEQLSSGDARLEQGVGLGLPIARKLTRAMGGELWYEKRFPVGSHFCFTLPLARSAADTADEIDLSRAASA